MNRDRALPWVVFAVGLSLIAAGVSLFLVLGIAHGAVHRTEVNQARIDRNQKAIGRDQTLIARLGRDNTRQARLIGELQRQVRALGGVPVGPAASSAAGGGSAPTASRSTPTPTTQPRQTATAHPTPPPSRSPSPTPTPSGVCRVIPALCGG